MSGTRRIKSGSVIHRAGLRLVLGGGVSIL